MLQTDQTRGSAARKPPTWCRKAAQNAPYAVRSLRPSCPSQRTTNTPPPTVAAAFVAQGIRPQNVYGMTENSSNHYTQPDDDTETIIATCGRGGPAYRVRIFDAEDPEREVPADKAIHVILDNYAAHWSPSAPMRQNRLNG